MSELKENLKCEIFHINDGTYILCKSYLNNKYLKFCKNCSKNKCKNDFCDNNTSVSNKYCHKCLYFKNDLFEEINYFLNSNQFNCIDTDYSRNYFISLNEAKKSFEHHLLLQECRKLVYNNEK